MLALIGIVLVFGAVFGGFLVEKGNPWVLMQPAELLIIGGSAIGIILVSNPPAVIGKMVRGVFLAFRPPRRGMESFLHHLRMLYEIFVYSSSIRSARAASCRSKTRSTIRRTVPFSRIIRSS
jgi:chemotaxis protein MotA